MGEADTSRPIPTAVQLVAVVATLVIWYVSWRYYGPSNLLWFSNLSALLLTLSLVMRWSLPASMAAVGVVILESVWSVDFFLRLATGREAMGLTEYVFLPQLAPDEIPRPLWARAVALYHLALVPALLWAVWRLGYDRRALRQWLALALVVGLFCVLATETGKNVNRVFGFGPVPHGTLPVPVYFGVWFTILTLFLWWPTHVALSRMAPKIAQLQVGIGEPTMAA